MFAQITPVILTFNEEPNIARTLSMLKWAARVVVVDSGSNDATLAICQTFANVDVVAREFDTHASQWNFALAAAEGAEWILALDADYVLTPELVDEIAVLAPGPQVAGYRLGFRYCVAGKPLRGTLYPAVTALFRRQGARYVQDGHTQRLVVEGRIEDLQHVALHDDRKSLARWLSSQAKYAALESALLQSRQWSQLRWQDRLRKLIVVTPWLVPLYCLTVGRGLLDGRAGLFYSLQRGVAEAILSLHLLEHHIRRRL